jgi:hypothetical protein
MVAWVSFNWKKGAVISCLSPLNNWNNNDRFITKSIREYLREIKVNHEFAYISTPVENAYIETFHSKLERKLTSRYEFDSYFHAEMKIA